MKFSDKSIVALMIFSIKAFHITDASSSNEDAAVPFHITSTQEKRLLNTCATFLHDGSSWRVDGTGDTLDKHCTTHDCCKTSGGAWGSDVNDNNECTVWNIALPYTICGGSCQGGYACYGIAENASGGSVKINSDACKGGSYSCYNIGQNIQGNVDVEIGSGACAFGQACEYIGGRAGSVTRIEVPANECLEMETVSGSYDVGKCNQCGFKSTFDGIFQATDACCAADGTQEDEACNIAPPPEEPNPCENINCSNRGKCQVLSLTEAECKCENSFIPSENKLDCICPSNHEFNADVNRCFPITEVPSKSPTISLTQGVISPPTPITTCVDDSSHTFTAPFNNADSIQDCEYIANKICVRGEKYCDTNSASFISNQRTECCATCSTYDSECANINNAPSKSPTISPPVTSSASPSQVATAQEDVCEDDETATFKLVKMEWEVPCSWITQNWKKRAIREENYCGLDEVKAICPATCGLCT